MNQTDLAPVPAAAEEDADVGVFLWTGDVTESAIDAEWGLMARLLDEDIDAGLGDGGGDTLSKLGRMKITHISFCERGDVEDW